MNTSPYFNPSLSSLNFMHSEANEKFFTDFSDVKVGSLRPQPVYCEDDITLYYYKSPHKNPLKIPVLIIFALVNKPYILDLMKNCSFIKDLLEQGISIYLIDWGHPHPELSLSTYINSYVHNCINHILSHTQQTQIHLMGICQGGLLSLCYSCLFPQVVRTLIPISTPVDFHQPGNMLTHHLSSIDIRLVIEILGNIPGPLITQALLMLNPFRSIRKKMNEMNKVTENPSLLEKFMCIEKWIHDSPDHAGRAFKEFVCEFYQKNNLIKHQIKINSKPVHLSRLTMPILNIMAENDTLIPASSSLELGKYVASNDYRSVLSKGGHISLYISDKVRKDISQTIGSWLKER